MIISYRDRFIFFHTPKVAGVSMRHFIQTSHRCTKLETHISDENKKKLPFQAYPHLFRVVQRHTTVDDYTMYMNDSFSTQVWNEFWKFAFVRNPWDRLVSLYHWNAQISSELAGRFEIQFPTVGEWVPQLYDNWANSKEDFNLLPQHKWTHHEGERQAVDFIGRFENIQEDYKVVLRHMGLPEDSELGRRNVSKHNDYRTYYTDETAKQVSEIFARDIELFSYEFG
jgi:hypothetical protein